MLEQQVRITICLPSDVADVLLRIFKEQRDLATEEARLVSASVREMPKLVIRNGGQEFHHTNPGH
jgi:hypothetical protein